MILDVAGAYALARACGPSVAPETLMSIVHAESHFNTLAIGVNSPGIRRPEVATKEEAVAAARALIRRGVNIDLGLGQINSANLAWLGLSIEQAFEPCANLAAAARVLTLNYRAVARLAPTPQHAIATALSLYNTGDRRRGFSNGYVAKVYASAAHVIPQMGPGATVPATRPASPGTFSAGLPTDGGAPVQLAASTVETPRWDVEAQASQASLMVFGDGTTASKGQHP
ncbi:type IV secretion system protein VirB1 [Sphingobium sp. OAS761]|uniref:lytic transglycosylase domain-containing protein n=1 Tax=Sphingobium sp. OAS761 TaxID=2817901 RepID=UPI00209D0AAA|nr:type IV secretion system protein VirB1 [Sphingobium sp. OAS761]